MKRSQITIIPAQPGYWTVSETSAAHGYEEGDIQGGPAMFGEPVIAWALATYRDDNDQAHISCVPVTPKDGGVTTIEDDGEAAFYAKATNFLVYPSGVVTSMDEWHPSWSDFVRAHLKKSEGAGSSA